MTEKTAIVVGATGLTGRALLTQLTTDTRYGNIIALVRKPTDFGLPRVTSQVVDFERMVTVTVAVATELQKTIHGNDVHAFCCLGTTIKTAGSQDAFRRVDFDYVVAFAKLAKHLNASHIGVISALGANAKSSVFYSRVKGEMETVVASVSVASTHVMRPSFLDGARTESRLGERISIMAANLISPLLMGPLRRYRAVSVDAVAATLLRVANAGGKGTVITESEAIF
jgi:uncharacterized protein YbjT (DUF2867 family)